MKKFITFLLIGVMALSGVPAAVACNGVAQLNNGCASHIVQRIVVVPVQGVAYHAPQIQQQQVQQDVQQLCNQAASYTQQEVATTQGCAQNLLASLNVNHGYVAQQIVLPHQNFIQHSQAVQFVHVRHARNQRVRLFNGGLRKRVQALFQNLRNRQQNRIVRVGQVRQVRNFHRVNQLNFRADRKVTGQLFIQQGY